jgi:serine/threonine protein phosphatase 1
MPRTRLSSDTWPSAVYAIGDVHGYLPQLAALEGEILADGEAIAGEKWIINLGDYVDRGPDSAGVIDHLLKPLPEGWRRIALVGNHDDILLQYLRDPRTIGWWLLEGGAETIESYGVDVDRTLEGPDPELTLRDAFRANIPDAHLAFLGALPVAVSLPGWFFVHAGIRPGIPLNKQSDEDLIWIRSPFLETQRQDGVVVVHGHTPGREPVITAWRVGLDTHCFLTGTLTGMRITPDGMVKLMSASGPVVPWR